MEYIVSQVMHKDLGRRLQVGQEIIDYVLDREKSHDLEHDQTMLDRMVDGLATSWVNSSNFKVNQMINVKSCGLIRSRVVALKTAHVGSSMIHWIWISHLSRNAAHDKDENGY